MYATGYLYLTKNQSILQPISHSFILLQFHQTKYSHTQQKYEKQKITDNTRIFLHFFCHFHFDLQIVLFVVVVGINIFGAVQSKNIKQQFAVVMYSSREHFYDGNIFLCCGVKYFVLQCVFQEIVGFGKRWNNFGFYFMEATI